MSFLHPPSLIHTFTHVGSVTETCFDQDKLQRETEGKLEQEAISMIIERLLDNKPSLYWHYTREVHWVGLLQDPCCFGQNRRPDNPSGSQ